MSPRHAGSSKGGELWPRWGTVILSQLFVTRLWMHGLPWRNEDLELIAALGPRAASLRERRVQCAGAHLWQMSGRYGRGTVRRPTHLEVRRYASGGKTPQQLLPAKDLFVEIEKSCLLQFAGY